MIAKGIPKLGDRDVLMVNMTADESFPIARAIEVLEAIPGPCRCTCTSGVIPTFLPASMSGIRRFLRWTLAELTAVVARVERAAPP